MASEIKTKAELAQSGSCFILSVLFILWAISLYFYWPLAIVVGIFIIYYFISSSKSERTLKESGEVVLKNNLGLLNKNKIHKDKIPFAVVVDVETTGLLTDETIPTIKKVKENPEHYPNIVQIAWITITRKYEIVSINTFYIKQQNPIPEEAFKIHRISNELCATKGVSIESALCLFNQDIESCEYMVAHNVMFDKYVIEAECLKNKLPKPFKGIKKYDTMEMGKSIVKRRKFKLEELAKRVIGKESLDQNNIQFHNAIDDVWVTASIFSTLHKNDIKY